MSNSNTDAKKQRRGSEEREDLPEELQAVLEILRNSGAEVRVIRPEDIKQGNFPDLIGSEEKESPPAIQALLQFVRAPKVAGIIKPHLVEDAKINLVGFIGSELGQRSGPVVEVLTSILAELKVTGGMADAEQTGQNEWTATFTLSRAEGAPRLLTAKCKLQGDKIASIEGDIEPTTLPF